MNEVFRRFAHKISNFTATLWAFMMAFAVIVIWLVTGPISKFLDTWQLVINTSTTSITFLMMFLIQNAQNRDARAIHIKLDELIRAVTDARNELVDFEDDTDENLISLEKEFKTLQSTSKLTSKL